jgi:hypothetical protein
MTMESAIVHRTLVVANRTAQTPVLLQEIDRRAAKRPTAFTLLVPDTGGKRADWTIDVALKVIRTAASGPERLRPVHVDGFAGGTDPFEAVKQALGGGDFHDVLISTLPERRSAWLKKKLPERVEALGVPVTVITPPDPSRDRVMSFLLPDRPDGRD